MKVFISYTNRDADRVLPLVERLKEGGIDVFIDLDLASGEVVGTRVETELGRSDAVLAFLSKAATKSPFVEVEIQRSLTAGRRVIPILIGDDHERHRLWPLLADRVSIDARELTADELYENIVKLLRAGDSEPEEAEGIWGVSRFSAASAVVGTMGLFAVATSAVAAVTCADASPGRQTSTDGAGETGASSRGITPASSALVLTDTEVFDLNVNGEIYTSTSLFGSTVRRSIFDGAAMPFADFRHSRIVSSSFVSTSLLRADFTGASLENCDFSQASLHGADLSDTVIEETSFKGALFDSSTRFSAGFDPVSHGMSCDDCSDESGGADSVQTDTRRTRCPANVRIEVLEMLRKYKGPESSGFLLSVDPYGFITPLRGTVPAKVRKSRLKAPPNRECLVTG